MSHGDGHFAQQVGPICVKVVVLKASILVAERRGRECKCKVEGHVAGVALQFLSLLCLEVRREVPYDASSLRMVAEQR
eukprot:5268689-Alexandrium_andersonii.AAC.1